MSKILVLAGGLSLEREVSLKSGQRVISALKKTKHEAVLYDTDANLIPMLRQVQPDIIFPVVHGGAGEDGTLQQLLELSNIPFIGSSSDGARVAFDKTVAKSIMKTQGIQTPRSVTLPRSSFRDLGASLLTSEIISRLGLPLCVKPRLGGSAFGVSKVTEARELSTALIDCFSYGDDVLIEEWITGTEVSVGIVDIPWQDLVVLPPVEIEADSEFYDYQARYTAGTTEFYIPARLDQSLLTKCETVATQAHRLFGLRHISRADLMIDASGEIYLLETTVSPGFTDTSTFPLALAATGMEFADLCVNLIEASLKA